MNAKAILVGVACLFLSACQAGPPVRPSIAGPPGELFTPPPGAKIIYQCNFDDGQADGWTGDISRQHRLPGSQAALTIGGGRIWASRKIKVPIA